MKFLKFWPYHLNQDGGVYYNMQIFFFVTQTYDVLSFILYFSWKLIGEIS